MSEQEDIPEDFSRCVIQAVEIDGEHLILTYSGRKFGGILRDLIPPEIAVGIKPGVELLVRYHTPETGERNQVAQMLIPHPADEGWAEIFAEWI